KNAQYFGFTGTPLFEQNKSQDGRVTADIFEKCLHTYLIKDAIHDGNELGFSVEYVNTFDVTIDETDTTRGTAMDTYEDCIHDEQIHMLVNNNCDIHVRRARSNRDTCTFTMQSIPMLL